MLLIKSRTKFSGSVLSWRQDFTLNSQLSNTEREIKEYYLRHTIFLSLNEHFPLFKPSHTDAVHVHVVIGWIVMV